MNKSPREIVEFVEDNRRLLLLPLVAFTLLAVLYAIFRPNTWDATQALYVRDESFGAISRGGRFESTDAMQTAQETIYEIAHHPEVLAAALREVGPGRRARGEYPAPKVVDEFRRRVSVTAPNGAQFGRTEMIYLTVKDRNRDRAVELTDALARSLMTRMKKLRMDRYRSIVSETEKGVDLARADLEKATARIERIEKEFGKDLAELRLLMDQGQGQGNVRQALGQIEGELRAAKAAYSAIKNQKAQLEAALNDPRRLINMPNSVLDNQPTLRRLKEGLVDAQLRASQLMGVMSSRHPDVQSAVKAVEAIRRQLHHELKIAVASLDGTVNEAQSRVAALERQQDLTNGRMGGLATIRTRYSNLATEVKQRASFLEEAESNLAIARSNMLSAQTVSLIHGIEQPIPGIYPQGPSRKMIVFGGLLLGLLSSLGLGFLIFPIDEPAYAGPMRRASDLQPADLVPGRYSTDRQSTRGRRDRRKKSDRDHAEILAKQRADAERIARRKSRGSRHVYPNLELPLPNSPQDH